MRTPLTAAVRNGFEDFLKRRAGKNDHRDSSWSPDTAPSRLPGARAPYILTYDSDPQDLKSTSLPMADLSAL